MCRVLKTVLLIGIVALLAGCGGDSAPTAVSPGDLGQTGDFWNELTPDLKLELVEYGKTNLGEQRPEGAVYIEAVSNDDLVREINRQYANEAKRSDSIYDTYVGANDQISREELSQLAPTLQEGP